MTKTYTFQHCWVHTSPGYTETVFHDGAKVPAAPEDSAEYRAKAEHYGYGGDTHAMSREHELLHTFLAEKLGYSSSPTMWALAHNNEGGVAPIWEQMEEESIVLEFQIFLNGGESGPSLARLTDAGLVLADLKDEAVSLLRS